MYVVLVLGLFFVGSALFNLSKGDFDDVVAATAIALVCFAVFAVLRRGAQKAEAFAAWLLANAAELQLRGARYEGMLVRPETVLVRHQIAMSFLIVSFRFETRPALEDLEPTFARALFATSLSLLLGWWGIPWGPIYTVQAVVRNLRGGVRQPVSEYLAALQAAAAPKADLQPA